MKLTQWPGKLAWLGLFIVLNACGENMDTSSSYNEALPVIEARIGDTWNDVIQHSTLKLGPLSNPAGTIIDKPHTFVYRDPRHPMRFENVGYMGVSVEDETPHRILDIAIGPYRQSAETEETWRRLQDLIQKMEQAGWIPDDDRNRRNPVSTSAMQLRSKYLNLPGGAEGAQKIWYDDYGNEAWVLLVKTITGREPGEEPRFNIVLHMQVASHPRHLKR